MKINELTDKSYQHKVCYSFIDYHFGFTVTATIILKIKFMITNIKSSPFKSNELYQHKVVSLKSYEKYRKYTSVQK